MKKLVNQKKQETLLKESKKLPKQEQKDIDFPRLTFDYLDETLQIA